jgi:hypothetical protein
MKHLISRNIPGHHDSRKTFKQRFELDYSTFARLRELLINRTNSTSAQSRFACYLALHLPEVAVLIDEDDFSVLHLEVSVLAKATSEAVECGDWGTVNKHFAFISDTLENIGNELRNAIQVSYLDYLLHDERVKSRIKLPSNDIQLRSISLDDLKERFGLIASTQSA